VLLTRSIDFSVFGESEILQVLQVPFALFLPGFLIAMVYWLVWLRTGGRNWSPADREKALFKPWSLEFAFLAVFLSLLMAFVFYQWFVQLPGISQLLISKNKDYFTEYALKDITQVYVFSVLFAIVTAGLVLVLRGLGLRAWSLVVRYSPGLGARIKSEIVQFLDRDRPIPQDRDKEITLLRKLDRNGLNHYLQGVWVRFGQDSDGVGLFLLEKQAKRGGIYVGPRIIATWKECTSSDIASIRGSITTLKDDPEGSAGKLAELLQAAVNAGCLDLSFERVTAPNGVVVDAPYLVPIDAIKGDPNVDPPLPVQSIISFQEAEEED
jgi:hypothetical protein